VIRALALLAALFLAGCQSRPHGEPIARKPRREVCLKIKTTHGFGTAFLCRWDGKVGVMTAWHVVKNAHRAPAEVCGAGVTLEIRFEQVQEADLAWAELPEYPKEWHLLEVGPDAQVGEYLQCWGYGGGYLQMRSGDMADLDARDRITGNDVEKGGRYCGLEPGMSGGPVLDAAGRVVAVAVMKIPAGIYTFGLDGTMIAHSFQITCVAVDLP
jgi:hypothetical protein